MSSPLAIAAVTEVLKDLLNDGLLDHNLPPVTGNLLVTSVPPDHISTGVQEPSQLNLFLYQVTANSGWRNSGLPSRGSQQGERLSNPPLALDLHYLLSAYGTGSSPEVLLGYAMYLLHENPVITRERLQNLFAPPNPLVDGTVLPGQFNGLSAQDIASQVEMIKVTPNYLSTEELSKLWTAMQSRYRPSMAYMVSVVLIQSTGPTKSALPVLKQGQDDSGPKAVGGPSPSLTGVKTLAAEALPAMRLGDDIVITGNSLEASADVQVVLENADYSGTLQYKLPPVAGPSPADLGAKLPGIVANPENMHLWRVGIWKISLEIAHPLLPVWRTNAVPIALAPLITLDPAAVKPNHVAVGSTVGLSCTPRLTPQQEKNVRVIFGDKQIVPKTVTTPADDLAHPNNHNLPTTVTFLVPTTDSSGLALKAGEYLIRLRVDGIDSIPVTLTGSPPQLNFDPQQKVNVV